MTTIQTGPDDVVKDRDLLIFCNSTTDPTTEYRVYGRSHPYFPSIYINFIYYFAKGNLNNDNYFSTIPLSHEQMIRFDKWLSDECDAKSVEGAVIQKMFRKTFC